MTTLYLVMHQYIVEDEDMRRAGHGVYSPVLRDDAQEARDELLAPLRDTPGQEAYFALLRVATEHPSKRGRDWAAQLAHARAITDSNQPGWGGSQVREFQESLERSPRNHEELHDLAIDRLRDFKHFIEHGETSIAEVLLMPEETAIRNVVADWCKTRGLNRYVIAQEEEFADKKRTDIRFTSMAFDKPVPVELKLANLWSGAELAERLENQLCNDYLRDQRSSRGIFLLIHQGNRRYWDLPGGTRATSLEALTVGLQAHWAMVAKDFSHVHAVQVIGIDLTVRAKPKGRPEVKDSRKKTTQKAKKTVSPTAKKAARKGITGSPKPVSGKKPAATNTTKKTSQKKAVAKKANPKKVVAKKTVPKKTVTEQASPKKAVQEKAAAKKASPRKAIAKGNRRRAQATSNRQR
ncbi:hypothetical protein [Xanthomonas arboricola]|uniref:hypothetical protein n=1 Tax=Xanthomonas arboricola TaxID=56448 RepID=UPI0006CAF56E|nr:hypothetical protein [Xanthomonas arboricola]